MTTLVIKDLMYLYCTFRYLCEFSCFNHCFLHIQDTEMVS